MVFQDPKASLNPLYTIGEQIGEGMRAHRIASNRKRGDEAIV